MTDHDRLARLLRSALPRPAASVPSRDLWPSIAHRSRAWQGVSWLDIGIAAGAGIFLLIFPDWLWLLAYHL